jgi:hypothetical protein
LFAKPTEFFAHRGNVFADETQSDDLDKRRRQGEMTDAWHAMSHWQRMLFGSNQPEGVMSKEWDPT